MANVESVLVPVTEFGTESLGRRLAEIVALNSTKGLLDARHMLGPQASYADKYVAIESVERSKSIHRMGLNQILVVVGDEGDPEGTATIHTRPELSKLHLPVSKGALDHKALEFIAERSKAVNWLTKRSWWTDFDFASPNVKAWTGYYQEALLAKAYQEVDERINPTHNNEFIRPWTIEPRRSPRYIHEAIRSTSLQRVARGRFEDGESRSVRPPRSVLYARLHSEWVSRLGRLNELRTGETSLMTGINESYVEDWKSRQGETRQQNA